MRATSVMTRDVYTVTPSTSLSRAFRLMRSLGICHLPVVMDDKLCGIVSDRDLLRVASPVISGQHLFPLETVATVMSVCPITARPEASIADLAALMVDHRIHSIPITSVRGELRGLVTSTDLIQLLREAPYASEVLPFEYHIQPAEQEGWTEVA